MDIKNLLNNSSDENPQKNGGSLFQELPLHGRSASLALPSIHHSSGVRATSPYTNRSWTSSPDNLAAQTAPPPIASVNGWNRLPSIEFSRLANYPEAPSTATKPFAHPGPPSIQTSPALSSASSATTGSPCSSRSSPPLATSPRLHYRSLVRHMSPQATASQRTPFVGHRLPSHPPTGGRERREFRPTYKEEEEHFIWYCRDDLGLDWHEVRARFNLQFPHRHRAGMQGLQCKYYRCTNSHGIPSVRERNRQGQHGGKEKWTLRAVRPEVNYPWMRQDRPRQR